MFINIIQNIDFLHCINRQVQISPIARRTRAMKELLFTL